MSVGDGTSAVPPGWYPDPADDARLRRWDGHNWTQDVILNPDGAPATPLATHSAPPPSSPDAYSPPSAPQYAPPVVQSAPEAPAVSSPPEPIVPEPIVPEPIVPAHTGPATSAPPQNQPPTGQPVPASPAPGPPPLAEAALTPPTEAASMPPTIPRPSPPVNQHPNPQSGPVSLPEWATLPGLTLPPDLSSIPGLEDNSVLPSPTFAEPVQRGLPTLPAFEPPFIPQRPDVQDAGAGRTGGSKSKQGAAPQTDAPYAPPPLGGQYDVPPPPGMAHVPIAGPLLPPSSLVAPVPSAPGWLPLPPVAAPGESTSGPAGSDRGPRARSSEPVAGTGSLERGPATLWAWLIGLLPLVQFALIYVAFGILKYPLYTGMQWGILLAPAAFSLLFANADRTKLAILGADAPGIPFAIVPPLYLLVRCLRTGPSSIGPLVLWLVVQAAAIAGLITLLPALLSVPIPPFS